MQNKKEPLLIMTVNILLSVVIFMGIGAIIIGGGYIIVKQESNVPANNIPTEKCAKAGEMSSNPSLGPKNNPRECCEGLVEISAGLKYDPNNEYVSADKNGCIRLLGSGCICSDCGNGICENWENKCNCPEDCGEKDETADWKTYRNEEYGFEFQYPDKINEKEISVGYNIEPDFTHEPISLLLVEFPYLEKLLFQEQSINPHLSFTDNMCYANFYIEVIKKEPSFSLEEIKQSHKKSEYIIIDEIEGVKRNEFIGKPPGGGGKEDLVWLSKDSETYLFYYIVDKEILGETGKMFGYTNRNF